MTLSHQIDRLAAALVDVLRESTLSAQTGDAGDAGLDDAEIAERLEMSLCLTDGGAIMRTNLAALGLGGGNQAIQSLKGIAMAGQAPGEFLLDGPRPPSGAPLADDLCAMPRRARGPANVEFVSAYPTAPLRARDASLAIVGDCVARLLACDGWEVTREYLSNDAGQQVSTLARVAFACYCALGQGADAMPDVPGYLIDIAHAIQSRHGDTLMHEPEESWFEPVCALAIAVVSDRIRDDLALLGITMDLWVSDAEMQAQGLIDEAMGRVLPQLLRAGVPVTDRPEPGSPIMDPDGPSVLRTPSGDLTYFAADLAYHQTKIDRGFLRIVDLLRPDHGTYLRRLEPAMAALAGTNVRFSARIVPTTGFDTATEDGAQPDQELTALVAEMEPNALRLWLLLGADDALVPGALLARLRKAYAQTRDAAEREDPAEPLSRGVLDHSGAEAAAKPRIDQDLQQMLLLWPAARRIAIETLMPERVARYVDELALHLVNERRALRDADLSQAGAVLRQAADLLGVDLEPKG